MLEHKIFLLFIEEGFFLKNFKILFTSLNNLAGIEGGREEIYRGFTVFFPLLLFGSLSTYGLNFDLTLFLREVFWLSTKMLSQWASYREEMNLYATLLISLRSLILLAFLPLIALLRMYFLHSSESFLDILISEG